MDTRLDDDVKATTEESDSIIPPPPRWLFTMFAFLSPPPGENTGPNFIVASLWWAHRRVRKVLARLPLALLRSVYFSAVQASYWKTTLVQACVLFSFFADVLSGPMIVILTLT